MPRTQIRPASRDDLETWLCLRKKLWPETPLEQHLFEEASAADSSLCTSY
jgi:hypothetical protein